MKNTIHGNSVVFDLYRPPPGLGCVRACMRVYVLWEHVLCVSQYVSLSVCSSVFFSVEEALFLTSSSWIFFYSIYIVHMDGCACYHPDSILNMRETFRDT